MWSSTPGICRFGFSLASLVLMLPTTSLALFFSSLTDGESLCWVRLVRLMGAGLGGV